MLKLPKVNFLLATNSNRILALMLLSLHAYLMVGNQTQFLQQSSFLITYALFLIWQPIWQSSDKLAIPAIILFIGVGIAGFFYFNWWVAALSLAILFGLLGGRVFSEAAKSNRIVHIMAASYLLTMLLLWVVPKILGESHQLEAANFVIRYIVPLLPIIIFFIGNQQSKSDQLPALDFFYTLLLMLVAVILILGSYTIGSLNAVNYIQVLFIALFSLAAVLMAFSLLWQPSTRFSGIELLMSRYLLSIGMPFEKWVQSIAAMAELESNANSFLQAAMQEMTKLPWVLGVSWLADESQGKLGIKSAHTTEFTFKDFHMSLHTNWQISPALYVHVKLLTQIVGEFYEAKRREETLRQNAYMQAFYETGSRLTHDIKNILQSVGTLVSAAEQTEEKDNDALIKLIRRQLPLLNQRIGATLDKLKSPGVEKKRLEKMEFWWKNLQLRHIQHNITFKAENLPKQDINAEVLDSVVDNLLSNAIEKGKYQPNTSIKVEMLEDDDNSVYVDVSDTGNSMSTQIANDLFKKHIASHNGLGVGLYHAAQDCNLAGYELSLQSNINGAVRFRVLLTP